MTTTAFFPLETSRLILRPFSDADVAGFQAYRNDPQVARYQGWSTPYSLEQAAAFIADMKSTPPGEPGRWLQIAIERKDSGELIGDCAFVRLAEDPRQAEIAYTLAGDQQGRGYATEAVGCLIERLFTVWPLHRIRANCDPLNSASAALLLRVGMRHEGRFIDSLWYKGGWASEDWFAMLRREWEERRA
jgi:aminoglycoside 6'-N-acetyltransferase